MLRATTASYVISPTALAAVAPDPGRSPDRLSARWLLAVAARLVRDVGALLTGAAQARKPVATFAMDGEVRFASAADRGAFAEELISVITVWSSPSIRPSSHSRRSPEMSRKFELNKKIELDASPEQVWEAIATGPGISSWFMGPHEIEPRVGGTIKLTLGDFSEQATITAWDPPKRLAYRGAEGADGSFHAMEYLIEGHEGAGTVLRFVHSGFLSDDWDAEYEDMTSRGWDRYLHTLAQYLTYFTGRPGTFLYAEGPTVVDDRDGWTVLTEALGLTGPLNTGDRVRLTPEGLAPIEGVVDYVVPGYREFLGVRGSDGLYRFQGGGHQINVGHHLFTEDLSGDEATKAWQAWLNRAFFS